MTTVNPATPGTPAENNYTALMEDSLQQEGEKLDSSEAEAAASPAVVPQENQSSQKKKLPKGIDSDIFLLLSCPLCKDTIIGTS